MRKHCSNVCKLRPCPATESTISARVGTIVSAALQRQYSQTELIFWIILVYTYVRTYVHTYKYYSPRGLHINVFQGLYDALTEVTLFS